MTCGVGMEVALYGRLGDSADSEKRADSDIISTCRRANLYLHPASRAPRLAFRISTVLPTQTVDLAVGGLGWAWHAADVGAKQAWIGRGPL